MSRHARPRKLGDRGVTAFLAHAVEGAAGRRRVTPGAAGGMARAGGVGAGFRGLEGLEQRTLLSGTEVLLQPTVAGGSGDALSAAAVVQDAGGNAVAALAGAVDRLEFVTPAPATLQAGDDCSFTVTALDMDGNVVTSKLEGEFGDVLHPDGGAVIGYFITNRYAPFVAGTRLTVAGTYRFEVVVLGKKIVTDDIVVTAAAPAGLRFDRMPATITAGGRLATPIRVQIVDAYGNRTAAAGPVTLAAASGPGTMTGALTVEAVNGEAVFDDLAFSAPGTYTFTAASGGFTGTSAARLADPFLYTLEGLAPVSRPGVLAPFTVKLSRLWNHGYYPETNIDTTVTLSAAGGGDGLAGTLTVPLVNGVATFNDVAIMTPGRHTLVATVQGVSATAYPIGNEVNVVAPATLEVTGLYSIYPYYCAGSALPDFSVRLLDETGTPIAGLVTEVTLTGPGGPYTATTADGVAVFKGVVVTTAGLVTFSASALGLSGDSQRISVQPGTPVEYVMDAPAMVEAGTPFVVSLRLVDAWGNAVMKGGFVRLLVAEGPDPVQPGTYLGHTTIQWVGEIPVTFTRAGTYRFMIEGADSLGFDNTVVVTPGAASALRFAHVDSVPRGGGPFGAVTVAVTDAWGNALPADAAVALTFVSGPAGAALPATATVNAVNGVATFTNLGEAAPGTYRLRATADGFTGGVDGELVVEAFNTVPTLAGPVNVTLNVLKTGATLSASAQDDRGEANLTYLWAATAVPEGAEVQFGGANGTNAAKAIAATFSRVGAYTLNLTVRDAEGLELVYAVNVSVEAAVATLTVSPGASTVPALQQVLFSASATDQFGQPLVVAPAWGVDPGVSIGADGLLVAGMRNGIYKVTATAGGKTAFAKVTVTGGTPAAPTQVAAAAVSPTSVKVTWVLADPEAALSVFRWNGAAWVAIASVPAGTTMYVDYAAAPDAQHYYFVRAHTSRGSTWADNYAGARTPPLAAAIPPAPPADLAAVAVNYATVRVTWKVAGDEAGVVVKRWTGATWVTVATLPAGSTSFTETGLAPATQYYYDAVAVNGSGETWAPAYTGAKTLAATAPTAATGLAFAALEAPAGASADVQRSARITWTAGTNASRTLVTKWNGSQWQIIAVLSGEATSFVDPAVWHGTTYCYRILTENPFGQAWSEGYLIGHV